jgi:hypothetical protein
MPAGTPEGGTRQTRYITRRHPLHQRQHGGALPLTRRGTRAGVGEAAQIKALHGIDRAVRNVETGRFERSLSGLTAVGAIVTAGEIYFEHDKASFGNKWMWAPIVMGPLGLAAGAAGVFSQRLAKTFLPVASVTIIANGVQGTWLHARAIKDKPGGWSNWRYNMEMGPPLLAPLLVVMVGGMGLLAAILRREL